MEDVYMKALKFLYERLLEQHGYQADITVVKKTQDAGQGDAAWAS